MDESGGYSIRGLVFISFGFVCISFVLKSSFLVISYYHFPSELHFKFWVCFSPGNFYKVK